MAKQAGFTPIQWPVRGLSVYGGFTGQNPGTTSDCLNVRSYDPLGNRLRGAQRAGITKYCALQPNSTNFIQNLNHVSVASAIVPATGNSSRTLTGVCVSGGSVYQFTRSVGFTPAAGGTSVLSATQRQVNSAVLFSKVYFADGSNWILWNAATNTASAWAATAGSLPVSGSDKPRLICTWRGRIVLSGIVSDAQNWFMSRQFVGTDFDYFPNSVTNQNAQQAVAGNNAEAGQCPDVVTCLIPYSDDVLIYGGDNSIWQMTGDPAAGGQFDRISDTVGIAFGTAWCKDAYGSIYFMGSRGGLYRINPSAGGTAAPERISSTSIDELLLTIDMNASLIRMAWDDRFQTVQIYITPTAGTATYNYAYDLRNQAFWRDQFSTASMNPTAVHLMDGDDPADRVVLLGGQDGYVRFLDVDASHDDGVAISSYIVLGPIQANSSKLRLRELRPVLGMTSDPVTLEVYVGNSAEDAFSALEPRLQATIPPGKGPAIRTQAVGQGLFIKLSNSVLRETWQFESLHAWFESLGRASGRQVVT